MAMREFEHECSAWVAKIFFLCQSLNLSDFLGTILVLHLATKFDKVHSVGVDILRQSLIKAQFVGVDAHIDPRAERKFHG